MGFLSEYAPPQSDLTLLFQIIIFSVLVAGLFFKLRRRYLIHAALMGIALILHTASILAVMVPSLLSKKGIFENLSTRFSIVTASHAALGIFVEVLGIWIVGSWIFSGKGTKTCVRKKRPMGLTIVLWLSELLLGIYLYALLYVLV